MATKRKPAPTLSETRLMLAAWRAIAFEYHTRRALGCEHAARMLMHEITDLLRSVQLLLNTEPFRQVVREEKQRAEDYVWGLGARARTARGAYLRMYAAP
jgi:hypothetical protein